MEEQNPWWKSKDLTNDPDLRKWYESRIKWIPKIINEIKLEPFSLNFIFGPRQVGKTTLVKLVIKKLLESVEDPRSIFYYRCDRLSDYKELDIVMENYLMLKRAYKIKTAYIFLDEITFPREWYRAVKYRIDSGDLQNDVLILTGSWSMFVRREVETFPGRRGGGRNIVFHPLSFREFLKIANPDIYNSLEGIKEMDPSEVWEKCVKARPWLNEVNRAFESYLECGGFPLAIKSLLERGEVSEEAKDAIISSFISDIAKLRRSESIAKRVIKAVLEKLPSAVSLSSIAKEFEIGSHKTVFYYLDLFEKMFILKNIFFIEPNKLVELYYKQRKIHLTDPFLYTVFSEWCMTRRPSINAIVESTVAAQLARKLNIGYWRDKTEIDIVIPGKAMGIEVKWGARAELRERRIGRINRVITLTRDEFKEKPVAVPVSLFLGCLDLS
ncbi:MAG: ATP-binding protein [Candidatus Methanodesulfokora sp.]|jgi:predicted AAA+ superfamily ATPase